MKEIIATTYNPKYRNDFIRLNREWIERYFRIEESDIHTFNTLETDILDKGGQIFIALAGDKPIGCCALIPHPDDNCYELAKMAVSPEFQGHGVGRKLGETLIRYAKEHGVRTLFLEGNTQLAASIALYRRLGFIEEPINHPVYNRCDIMMKLEL